MYVCAIHRNITYNPSACVSIGYYHRYPLPPGGNVTFHFQQLVVADVITIRRVGFLTLCEVDVFGTEVVLAPEGYIIYLK